MLLALLRGVIAYPKQHYAARFTRYCQIFTCIITLSSGVCYAQNGQELTAEKPKIAVPTEKPPAAHQSKHKDAESALQDLPTIDWANEIHTTISNRVYQTAQWFDDFFVTEGHSAKPVKASAKIRLGTVITRDNKLELESRFSLRVKLPNLEDKVAFILSDDTDEQLADLPLESTDQQNAFTDESLTAAIQYINAKSDRFVTDTRLGISDSDPFVRVRHRQAYWWKKKHGLSAEPALYYFANDGWGARLLLAYHYQIDQQSQLRLNYSVRKSETLENERWKTGVYYLQQFDDKKAASLGFVSSGQYHNKDEDFVTEHKLSYRYRFNAHKKWLFFEIEPFVEWAKWRGSDANPGIALRIEGYFERS